MRKAILFLLSLAAAASAAEKQLVTRILAKNLNDPMKMAIAKDGKVYFIERNGNLKLYDPASNATTLLNSFRVRWYADARAEGGLIGIALDPKFDSNKRMYLYYSADSSRVVARFSLGSDGKLDTATKKVLLSFPYPTYDAHHPGADLTFDADGNLYIGVGDDTFNDGSDGYSPTDERSGRVHYDAQKSAGDTKSFDGKILRIHPEDDGSYTIPSGNLFADTAKGLKEIYVMGCRNPFSLSIDPKTGWLYWGEPGPNSSVSDSTRGPRGYDEVNLAKAPGNYGWPYFNGPNYAYTKFNFSDSTIGAKWDSLKPVNKSPNHKGLDTLPPAHGALMWYSYNNSREQIPAYAREPAFPEFGQGPSNAVMVGPLYRYDSSLVSESKLPAKYDNVLFVADWGRSFVKAVKIDAQGNPVSIDPFKDGALQDPIVETDKDGNFLRIFYLPSPVKSPMDLTMGPDGALYMLCWGQWNYPHSFPDDGTLIRLEMADPASIGIKGGYYKRMVFRKDGLISNFGNAQTLELPVGVRGFDLYNLNGAKIWSYARAEASAQANVALPAGLPKGLLQVRLTH